MPRRAAAQIRPVEPDPIYGSKLVQQVINKVMVDGKKSTAEKIVYDALDDPRRAHRQRPGRGARGVDQDAHPDARGPLAPRRRRHLPGARRGARPPRPHARRALARRVRPPAPREVDGRAARRRARRRPVPSRAAPTSARTTSTAWRRPTRPSRTTAGSRAACTPCAVPSSLVRSTACWTARRAYGRCVARTCDAARRDPRSSRSGLRRRLHATGLRPLEVAARAREGPPPSLVAPAPTAGRAPGRLRAAAAPRARQLEPEPGPGVAWTVGRSASRARAGRRVLGRSIDSVITSTAIPTASGRHRRRAAAPTAAPHAITSREQPRGSAARQPWASCPSPGSLSAPDAGRQLRADPDRPVRDHVENSATTSSDRRPQEQAEKAASPTARNPSADPKSPCGRGRADPLLPSFAARGPPQHPDRLANERSERRRLRHLTSMESSTT